jgi:hypothetical protein
MAMLDRLVDGAIVLEIKGPPTVPTEGKILPRSRRLPHRNCHCGPILAAEMDQS